MTQDLKNKLTIRELLKRKVANVPNRVFLKHGEREYTWLDIEIASCIVASDLYRMGVREGSHVGLCCPNSENWIFTFFAINKLNAVSILINPSYKPNEIATAITTADIEYLCYGDLQNGIDDMTFINEVNNEINNRINGYYSINKDKDLTVRFNEYSNMENRIIDDYDSDACKVFLFTSGSTGIPKAAMHSSRTMVYRAYRYIDVLDLKSSDIHCMIMPLFHIFSLDTTLLAAAVSDAKIVIPSNTKTSTIIKTIKEEKCTNFNSVPTMMIALLSNKDFVNDDLNSLRLSMVAGAIASPQQMKIFSETMPNNTFINIYGLSEFAPCTYIKYKYGMNQEILNSVGKPYDDIEIKIYNNKTNKECSKGQNGEILIRGYGAMMGYYNLPKEKQAIDSDGWLHTGDLGYINEDGNLCISGRIKEIIIRGGENIMPLEVARALEKDECIKDVKVIGVPDEFRGEEIAACITLKDGYYFNEENTKLLMNKYVSKHKIPRYFIIYDELPKLANGKIDVIKLKKDVENRLKCNKN